MASHTRSQSSRRPPWYLIAVAMVCVLGVAVPISYLLVRAFGLGASGGGSGISGGGLWDSRYFLYSINTLLLVLGVLLVTTLIALPVAWLTVRSDLPCRGLLTLGCVLPLAIPGYLMAYTLLAIGGNVGTAAKLTGFVVPRMHGYWGALIALSLYNFPYMVLNLRAAMIGLDPALEEIARSLGQRPRGVFFRVVVPQLRPALLAGALLIGLHVINDFGVVSLMNYRTLSYVLYLQYTGLNAEGAALIAILMLSVAGIFVAMELYLLRGLQLQRAGMLSQRQRRVVPLGRWKWASFVGVLGLLGVSVVVPVGTIVHQATRTQWDAFIGSQLFDAAFDSLAGALPAAVIATLLAAPIAYLARRYPGKRAAITERLSFIGYATPSLAFALGLIFVAKVLPVELYQKVLHYWPVLLIYAYSLHFLAEAVAPIRASLFSATPRLEEASRALGAGPMKTFWRVTIPMMRQGLIVAIALVFLSVMKELPLTMLLSPLDFDTLATRLWSLTDEALYAQAAPFAILILLLSSLFVGVLLVSNRSQTR